MQKSLGKIIFLYVIQGSKKMGISIHFKTKLIQNNLEKQLE